MLCFYCKCPLLQLTGEDIPHYGDHIFCSIEHRAYYRAGVPLKGGSTDVAQPDLFEHAETQAGRS